MGPDWVLFDLDNTLWDFDLNAGKALNELFHRHNLEVRTQSTVHEFTERYQQINAAYWKRYEKGEVTKDVLRTARFTDTFVSLGIPPEEHPENIWEEYLEICPQMTELVSGALDVLTLCYRNAHVGLITNGFARTQQTKVAMSGIGEYIQFMLTSEDAGIAKPHPGIFETALRLTGKPAEKVIYIGDTYHTDIEGAVSAGLPAIWFNVHGGRPEPEMIENPLFKGTFPGHGELLGFMQAEWGWV